MIQQSINNSAMLEAKTAANPALSIYAIESRGKRNMDLIQQAYTTTAVQCAFAWAQMMPDVSMCVKRCKVQAERRLIKFFKWA